MSNAFLTDGTCLRAAVIVSFAYIKCLEVSSRHVEHNFFFTCMQTHKNLFSASLMGWKLECKPEYTLWKHVWYIIKLRMFFKKTRDYFTEKYYDT